jgi:hypothetical protein
VRASSRVFKYTVKYLTPGSRVLYEELIFPQLMKKFLAFYLTQRFSTAFTRARNLTSSWAETTQHPSTHTHSFHFLKTNFMSSHLHLVLAGGFFCRVFRPQTLYAPFVVPYVPHAPPILFFNPGNISWKVQIMKLPTAQPKTNGMTDWTVIPYSKLTIEESPTWEASSFSASQEIPHVL